ncbi:MAG TPA: histidine phosphatase family protein [Candidatus Dormibacteraeota bacterium]|nr:histidine phosphatase family protein [Candidatus Dormibacteraeota bacterium]
MSNSGEGATPPDLPETTHSRPLQLILVRHGSSTWNDERRIQGQLDPPLSEKGRDQAHRLGARFRGVDVVGFYSSDLQRAVATAAAIAEELGREPELLPALREVALGEWEGLNRDEVVARYPEQWERWRQQPLWDIVPGGEGAEAFERRVAGVIDELTARHSQGRVIVVTHAGVIQVALLRVVGRSSNGLFPFTIGNTSLTVLEGSPDRFVVGRVNDTCHLY